MVVFDTTTLALLLDPNARVPLDAEGSPVSRCADRINHLLEGFAQNRTVVILPTPVIAELLTRAGDAGPAWLETFKSSARFQIAPFDTVAAVELAQMTRLALDAGDKKDGSAETWTKVRFDRQIVAIARVWRAETVYSDDRNLRAFGLRNGLKVVGMGELPLPPKDEQTSFLDELAQDPPPTESS